MSRWSRPGGYRDVLTIGLPMVISLGSTTVMQFTDRVFLGNYSLEAIAAALPAGIASFLFISLAMGVATYVNVFIAQYVGRGRPERVGDSLWAGIHFSLLSTLGLAALWFAAEPLMALGGHAPEVQALEVDYFRILTLGAGLNVLGPCLSCFYSGRGLTRPVMVVNIIGAVINIPLDYALINGVWGFPELGIRGAALATVVSWAVIAGLFALLIFRRRNEGFGVFSRWRFDAELFGRLMKYGGPGGVQFFIDVFGITFFIFMVGRIGNAELAATNIVLSIDTLAFLPTVGLSIAVSTLVGQAIGEGNPERAVFATHNTIHVAMLFMGLVAAAFVLLPETLMVMFRPEGMSQAEYAPIVAAGVVLLRLCALFTLCDSALITLIGALKGAGDSRFVMWTMGAASLFVLVIPSYLAVEHFGAGLYGVWGFLVAYVILLSGVCWVRFRRGRWKDMSVLEDELAPSPLN